MADRDALIAAHLELPKKAASMLYPRVRDYVEYDELVAMGNAGLAEAAGRYDPSRGASFSTFAWYRVYGAIVDGLRRSSTLPRRTWAKLVALRAAGEYLEHRGERDAGARAAGAPAQTTEDQLTAVRDAIAAIQTVYLTSLEGLREQGGDLPEVAPGADQQLDTARLSKRVREAITQLPERERQLLEKHYFEGKNLLEAGAELGISKSWASRMHAQAVDRLRQLIAA
ncbi:MAG: sigma-70 family RNA polymerase sigma factor [Kofleriaceae bacterium]|nr:sigma-70 family RNA polymerase sigma factor [Kofleriaceae bacterium]MBP9204907.1 sigma-70 family RNA polymerase sigma factor [Kofleriaceae bacterium]